MNIPAIHTPSLYPAHRALAIVASLAEDEDGWTYTIDAPGAPMTTISVRDEDGFLAGKL